MLPSFSAVILDMDGLVLDTEAAYRFAWQCAAKAMGLEIDDAFCRGLSGCHGDEVERQLKEKVGSIEKMREFHHLSADCWWRHVKKYGIKVKPGVSKLLETLRPQEVPFCLATNSKAANALDCLALAGLENVFSMIVSRDDVERGKPSPDIYLKAANMLGVRSDQCIAVEDSFTGIIAASWAGTFPVLIPDGGEPSKKSRLLAHLVLNSLEELNEWIAGESRSFREGVDNDNSRDLDFFDSRATSVNIV